jgi:hypothetical protein
VGYSDPVAARFGTFTPAVKRTLSVADDLAMRGAVRAYRRRMRRHRLVRRLQYVVRPTLTVGLLILAGVYAQRAFAMNHLVPAYEKAKDGTASGCNQATLSDRPCVSFLTGRVVVADASMSWGGRIVPASWGLTVQFVASDRSSTLKEFRLYKQWADRFPPGGEARVYYIARTPFGIIAPNETEWHPLLTNPKQQRRDNLVYGAPFTVVGLFLLFRLIRRTRRVLSGLRARRRLSMRVAW